MAHDRSNLPEDFKLGTAWGISGDPAFDMLNQRFRPLFARIRENAIKRELRGALGKPGIRL